MNLEETNQKILELMNKEDHLSEEEIQLFKELIYQCNLKIQSQYGSPLLYALKYNKEKYLNINKDQWDYFIKNSDLKQQNFYGDTNLIYVFINNKSQKLNLNQEQLDYLIQQSDLKQQSYNGWTTLIYALTYNKTQNLKLTTKQFKEMYECLDKEEQQTIFQKLIQENNRNKNTYLKEINILLYDFEFKPNQETIHWLKENQHQDILERVEKRDLFFQLNKTIKKIDNHKKIDKIKI